MGRIIAFLTTILYLLVWDHGNDIASFLETTILSLKLVVIL